MARTSLAQLALLNTPPSEVLASSAACGTCAAVSRGIQSMAHTRTTAICMPTAQLLRSERQEPAGVEARARACFWSAPACSAALTSTPRHCTSSSCKGSFPG